MSQTELRWATFVPVFIATGMSPFGCSSSVEGGGAVGGAGAGGGGGEGGAYVSPHAEQDALCDPYETQVECIEDAATYCDWFPTTYRVPADSCEFVGPVARCVYEYGSDIGHTPDDGCPGEPEFSRYFYRPAEPGWYDVVVLTGWAGMRFSDNGWTRCTVGFGFEQPPFCECLCAVD